MNITPAMLMEETKAAARARVSGRLEGVRPPPISTRPPTAVRPDGEDTRNINKKLQQECKFGHNHLILTPDLRWRWWRTWGVSAERGSRPTRCGIPQSQPSRRWWPSEWRRRWGRWGPEPDRWTHLQRERDTHSYFHTDVVGKKCAVVFFLQLLFLYH